MTRQIRYARAATTAVFLLHGTLIGVWATEVPLVRDRLALAPARLALALVFAAAGAMLAMPLAGRGTARFGVARLMRAGAAVACIALPGAVVAPDLPSLAAALFVFGIGFGTVDVAMNVQAVLVEQALGRPILSSVHAMWSLGGLCGSAGGAVLLTVLPPVWQAGLVCAACGVAMLAAAGSMLAALPPAGVAVEPSRVPGRPWGDRGLLLIGLLMCLSFAVEGAVLDWGGIYLRDVRGASPASAAIGYSAFSAAMVLTRFAGDRARAAWGNAGMLRGAWVAALGLALVLAAPGPAPALLGFALAGAGIANVVPVLFRLAGARGGAAAAAAIGTASTLGYAGVLGGPPLFGLVAQVSSVPVALGLAGVLCGVIGLSAGRCGKQGQGSALDPPKGSRPLETATLK